MVVAPDKKGRKEKNPVKPIRTKKNYLQNANKNRNKTKNNLRITRKPRNTREKKTRIRETKNLLTDADSRTNTVLERLRDLSNKKMGGWGHLEHIPVFRALLMTTDPDQKADSVHAKMMGQIFREGGPHFFLVRIPRKNNPA